jgi:hypothetical protein
MGSLQALWINTSKATKTIEVREFYKEKEDEKCRNESGRQYLDYQG